MPPPVPPSVKLGRMIAGKPDLLQRRPRLLHGMDDRRARAFQPDLVHRLAELEPVLGLLDRLRVRPDQLDAEPVKVPSLKSASAVLSAVCPPIVGSTASGRSFSRILVTISGVIGSI